MERAYYIVAPGPARDALVARQEAILRQRSEIFKALKQVALATGCNPSTCLIEDNACVGLVFDRGIPSNRMCGWKKVGPDTYWPRMRTKAGKAIATVFDFAKPMDLEVQGMESCMLVSGEFVVTATYDEMRVDDPVVPEELASQLARIRPSAFQKMLDANNAKEEPDGQQEGT